MTKQSPDSEAAVHHEEHDERPWEHLVELLDKKAHAEVGAYVAELTPAETARCLDRLDGEHRELVLSTLDPESAAGLMEQLSDFQGSELLSQATPETAAAILEELPSDDQADLIAGLGAEEADSILARMEPDAAAAARALAAYPANTAGGLMVREYLAYPVDTEAGAVVTDLRDRADQIEDLDIQYIYVTADDGLLAGVLRLRDLLLTPSRRTVGKIMIGDPVSVAVGTSLDELVDLFESKAFLGLPVVDENRQLVGVVHRSDIDEAWEDRAELGRLKAQGIVGGEELRSMPVWRRSSRRLSWLSVNILLNVLAASVIAAYQDTIGAVITLAVFLPIISDMSGCSGNQAVAVSMRELTLGVVKPIDVLYVWRKELAVGIVNGLVLGLLLAVTAWLWQGNAMLGVVVGGALALNTLVAVSIGGAVPLILRRFGLDPALASGPILTTLTDMCGFFLVLSFAAAALSHLTS